MEGVWRVLHESHPGNLRILYYNYMGVLRRLLGTGQDALA